MQYHHAMRKILWFAGWYVGLSLLSLAGWLIISYPDRPSSPLGWACAFLLILPIQLAFEWLGTRISDNPLARRIDRCTSTKQVSLLRITYGLVMFCGLIACVLALAYGWRFLQAYLGW